MGIDRMPSAIETFTSCFTSNPLHCGVHPKSQLRLLFECDVRDVGTRRDYTEQPRNTRGTGATIACFRGRLRQQPCEETRVLVAVFCALDVASVPRAQTARDSSLSTSAVPRNGLTRFSQ